MMRHLTALSTGLAVLLVAPGTVLGGKDLAKLQTALEETLRSIEALTGLQKDHAITPSLALKITEAPALDPQAGDERLQSLRDEVSLLRMQLDTLEGLPVGFLTPTEPAPTAEADAPALSAITTGLSPELREELASLARPASPGHGSHGAHGAHGSETTPDAHDAPAPAAAQSADPVGEARACFYAGLFDRGLELLEPLETDVDALYWKGRILEKLDRSDEAIAALKASIRIAGDTSAGKRAQADLEFFEWKRDFLKRMERSADGGGRP